MLKIVNSVFSNNTASGDCAGLWIETSNFPTLAQSVITNCSFVGNIAQNYAGLYVKSDTVKIKDTLFESNWALDGDGGAVYLASSDSKRSDYLIEGCSFVNNTALVNGGAIAWRHQPQLIDNIFKDNRAEYGCDVASFGVELVIYSNDTNELMKVYNTSIYGAASGQRLPAPVIIALVDHYGAVVRTDNSSTGQIYARNTTTTAITGENRVVAVRGIYTYANAKVSAQPGTVVQLNFGSDAFTPTYFEDALIVAMELRECKEGEVMQGRDCVTCLQGTYNLGSLDVCQTCPIGAVCYGSNLMVPKPGYWRSSKHSANFIKCLTSSACLGSPNIVPELTGRCYKGYRGNLCQACEVGFSRSSSNLCAECPPKILNGLRIIGVILAACLVCAIQVKTTLNTSLKPVALHSIYLKIITNYLQLVLLTTELDLEWPAFIQSYFKAQNYPAAVDQHIFSFDCFLADQSNDYKQVYYDKMVTFALLPVLVASASVTFWCGMYYFSRKTSIFSKELVSTVVISFFLLHPSLTKEYFSIFSCKEIEGDLWLNSNLDIKCFDSTHVKYSVSVALPAILVWVLGVPTLILAYLTKMRRRLAEIELKLRFGFFYNGFRRSHFYWEFLIVYRKISIICIAVFVSNYSIPSQALTILLVLLIFLSLQYWQRPYTTTTLNNVEVIAILAATTTIFCGLYYLTDDIGEGVKIVLLIVIMTANIYFMSWFLWLFLRAVLQILSVHLRFIKRWFPPSDPFPEASLVKSPLAEQAYLEDCESGATHSIVYKKDYTEIEKASNWPTSMRKLYLEIEKVTLPEEPRFKQSILSSSSTNFSF